MSSRSRMMGAGNASSTVYNININENTFGGNKKQGITSRVGLNNWSNLAIQTYSNGFGREKLICMNQLGGVGAGKSMFNGRFTQKDGVHCNEIQKVEPIVPTPPSPYTYTSLDVANGRLHLWFTDPYVQITTQINVTIVVNSAAETTFEIVNYVGPTYEYDNYTQLQYAQINAGTSSFSIPGSSLNHYLAFQFVTLTLGGSFNIQSFKINNVEQLPTIPFVYP